MKIILRNYLKVVLWGFCIYYVKLVKMTSAHELQVMFCAFVAVAWLGKVM